MGTRIGRDLESVTTSDRPEWIQRAAGRLHRLYGQRGDAVTEQISELVETYRTGLSGRDARGWDASDVLLITYGDQVQEPEQPTLDTLRQFLIGAGLHRLIRTVHILPFFPYSSDDGFSVIDYRQVDPALGTWQQIDALGESFELMFDLVVNHVSQHSIWFADYLAGREPFTQYFIEASPDEDLSQVTRPRSLPLLTAFMTSRGERHVWTTFSDDQIDLNFAEPDVLVAMLDILLLYAEHGSRIIRLDAIAYLWKQIGTSCIHLSETHEVVKLMRDVLDEVAPGTWLLTETNVPHDENVSYFGNGDEAHIVYQFSLAPLLLDALLTGDGGPLKSWLAGLAPSPPGTTYLNFTASHDGIGMRPLEGLVSAERCEALADSVRARGGRINTRRNPDGSDTPYELNITYFDALGDPDGIETELHVRRFLTSQAIMLSLRGIPAVYFHSLVGTPNDQAGVAKTGHARAINRHKYDRTELAALLADEEGTQAAIFTGYRHLLETRIAQSAFHPDGDQHVLSTDDPAVLAFLRTSPDGSQRIVVVANLCGQSRSYRLPADREENTARDLLTGESTEVSAEITLAPYQILWLVIS